MISNLNKPNTGMMPTFGTVQDRLHQPAPKRGILRSRKDRNRTDSCNRITFPQKIAAHDSAIALSHDREDIRSSQDHCVQSGCDFSRREVRWKMMLLGNRLECFVADPAASRSVSC